MLAEKVWQLQIRRSKRSKVFFQKDSTFLDYVRGGLKVNMVCALDMSKSSASLHRCNKTKQTNKLTKQVQKKVWTWPVIQLPGCEKERMHLQRQSGRWPRSSKIMIMTRKSWDSPLGQTGEKKTKIQRQQKKGKNTKTEKYKERKNTKKEKDKIKMFLWWLS